MDQNNIRLPPLEDALNRDASPSSSTFEPLMDTNRPFPPPPSYTPPPPPTRDLPKSTTFPPAPGPNSELPPIKSREVNKDILNKALPSLPSLASVTGTPPPTHFALPHRAAPDRAFTPTPPPPPAPKVQRWPSVNPYSAYYTPSVADEPPLKLGTDKHTSSPESRDDGRASSVSLDDPDVRMAAEALGHLKTVSSPPARNTPLPPTPLADGSDPEPLLSLLTVAHPLLAKTIEGTTSAYTMSKNKSPRFVKSGVEYMEGYLTPIGGAIETVGKATGVEGGVRWYLGGSRRSKHHPHPSADPEAADGGPGKRRRVESGEVPPSALSARDVYDFSQHRRLSMSTINTMDTLDTLPAYDDVKSPAYSEAVGYPDDTKSGRLTPRPNSGGPPPPWQSRLIMSTSGLSIAMSEESLRSLKYCLSWIRWANEHIGTVVAALTKALDQLDGVKRRNSQQGLDNAAGMDLEASGVTPQERAELTKRIAALRDDVLKTLQSVVHTVSNYAGGALPENARILIRHHLTSLPQRFHIASQSESKPSPHPAQDGATGEAEADQQVRVGAHKVLVLAMEGLDMMSQVSGVLDGTIVSAEEWCERLGRKKKEQREDLLMSYTKPPTVSAEEFQKRLNLQQDQTASRDVLMQG